ncbi:hypothetical protein XPA_007936 [Xanthoria parietina]
MTLSNANHPEPIYYMIPLRKKGLPRGGYVLSFLLSFSSSTPLAFQLCLLHTYTVQLNWSTKQVSTVHFDHSSVFPYIPSVLPNPSLLFCITLRTNNFILFS